MIFKKKLLVIFSLLVLVVGLILYRPKVSGFVISKIYTSFSPRPEWEVISYPENLNDIFSQKFTYLGRGNESYAFVSEDQKTVLKFINMEHLTPRKWVAYLPFPFLHDYRVRKFDRREKRLKETFGTCRMAYEELKNETGLIFIHLNKTKTLNKTLTIVDKKGKEHAVDLDSAVFIVQEKAELFYARIKKFIQEGKSADVPRAVQSFLNFIELRCQKGYFDEDKGITSNYGFIGDRIIQIDIGRLRKKESHEDQVERARLKIYSAIKRHHPEVFSAFLEPVEARCR